LNIFWIASAEKQPRNDDLRNNAAESYDSGKDQIKLASL
jgi:hypothetical protein